MVTIVYTKSLCIMHDTSIACALEQVDIIANTPEGEFETDLLISGDTDGSLSFAFQLQIVCCN